MIETERERNRRNRERFVGGCDESKSGSHWTELRKSVDREDRRSGRRRRGRRR